MPEEKGEDETDAHAEPNGYDEKDQMVGRGECAQYSYKTRTASCRRCRGRLTEALCARCLHLHEHRSSVCVLVVTANLTLLRFD